MNLHTIAAIGAWSTLVLFVADEIRFLLDQGRKIVEKREFVN